MKFHKLEKLIASSTLVLVRTNDLYEDYWYKGIFGDAPISLANFTVIEIYTYIEKSDGKPYVIIVIKG